MFSSSSDIIIISYQSSLKDFFSALNHEWLEKYFTVTKEDDEILLHPENILNAGGEVFFAKHDEAIIGTCAMIKEHADEFELAKMAVAASVQGKGIGAKLIEACISFAKEKGATKINLETATQLHSAIALYRKYNFVQTSEEHIHPLFKRKTFKMELVLEK